VFICTVVCVAFAVGQLRSGASISFYDLYAHRFLAKLCEVWSRIWENISIDNPAPGEHFLGFEERPKVGRPHRQKRELAEALGRDFAARGIHWWILDLASPEIVKMMRRQVGAQLANAPMKFAPSDGVAFFEALGWQAREVCSIVQAAARFRRLPFFLRPFSWLPEANPRNLGRSRWSGVVRLELGR
jgi:hypothetical protein